MNEQNINWDAIDLGKINYGPVTFIDAEVLENYPSPLARIHYAVSGVGARKQTLL